MTEDVWEKVVMFGSLAVSVLFLSAVVLVFLAATGVWF